MDRLNRILEHFKNKLKLYRDYKITEIEKDHFKVEIFVDETFSVKKWNKLFHQLAIEYNISKTIEWTDWFGYIHSLKFELWTIYWPED